MKEHTKTQYNEHGRLTDDVYKHNMHDQHKHLVNFKDLDDFKVADGDPDVRGWGVYTSDTMEIGKVDDMVVDTNTMKVRYLIVDLYDDYAADSIDHYLLLPIGAARLDNSDNMVTVSGIKTTTVLNYPVFRRSGISREYEYSVRNFFERGGTPIAFNSDRAPIHRSSILDKPKHNPDVQGTRSRYDIENSHMDEDLPTADDTLRTTDTVREPKRDVAGANPLGQSNYTGSASHTGQMRNHTLQPRTTNLAHKEIPQGPSNPVRAEEKSTANLNRSAGLGTSLGHAEQLPISKQDADMPEHLNAPAASTPNPADDRFYDHDHFDEDGFYNHGRK